MHTWARLPGLSKMDDLAALVKDLEGSPRGDGWTRLFFVSILY